MTTIACVKVGAKYGPAYVNRLAAMVARHATRPYDFLCLTDDPAGLTVPWVPIGTDLPGWWAKLVLFRPHEALAGERVLFFDLDTVIVGSIDPLLAYVGPFAILQDWWAPTYNSSVMAIAPHVMPHLWTRFQEDPTGIMARLHGDQDWITERGTRHAALWQTVAPGVIGSYKADRLQAGPRDFAVVCFHGEPKPHTFTEGWVADAWR